MKSAGGGEGEVGGGGCFVVKYEREGVERRIFVGHPANYVHSDGHCLQ